MKTISGIEFASEHNGTDVFRVIELAYEQGWKDGHSEQLGTNLISRDAVKELLNNNGLPYHINPVLWKELNDLPSAQPEVKQISYTDCANAMLMMWMDKVLTDGEYNRIMDKLNEHEKKKRERQWMT